MASPRHHQHHLPLSLSSLLLLLLLLLSLSSAATTTTVDQACKATPRPLACRSSLSSAATATTPAALIQSLLSLSSARLQASQSMSRRVLLAFPHHRNRSAAATTCLDLLSMSHHRLRAASLSLSSRAPRLRDARAFAGAALTYQYDCWSELSYVNGTRLVDQAMSFLNSSLMEVTSDALSMMMAWDVYGEDTTSWGPPRTERDGFWEEEGKNARKNGENLGRGRVVTAGLEGKTGVNATVCKEGRARGCYARVQEAVDRAPSWLGGRGKFVIYIKEGVYEEIVRVPIEKTSLVFLGDGMGKTVITGSVNTGIMGISTYNTATVGVKGDGFMARGITFRNTAGPNAHQAVAFRSDSDLSVVEECEFLGNQDTLYAHSLRQVYRSCRVEGNVDFVFGNAAAVFEGCSLLVRPRQLDPARGENNAVTAQGRTDPAQPTGLVFVGCLINGTEEYMRLWSANPKVHRNYLGRPWKMYSRTVFIDSTIERLVSPEGWMPFRNDFALSTLYYGEFGNRGRGADLSKRVDWSSQIPKSHLGAYSPSNFIQADEWNSGFC